MILSQTLLDYFLWVEHWHPLFAAISPSRASQPWRWWRPSQSLQKPSRASSRTTCSYWVIYYIWAETRSANESISFTLALSRNGYKFFCLDWYFTWVNTHLYSIITSPCSTTYLFLFSNSIFKAPQHLEHHYPEHVPTTAGSCVVFESPVRSGF
jgi:hypothetical protein